MNFFSLHLTPFIAPLQLRALPLPLGAIVLLAVTAPLGAAPNPESAPVFATAVEPLMQKYCVSCHGPEKAKADLRLDTLAAMLKGGESGPAVVAGKSAASPLLKRAQLPAEHDDHMPPDGKPQPTAQELALVQWWVDAGAPANKSFAELKAPLNILSLAKNLAGADPSPTAESRPAPPAPAPIPAGAAPKPLPEVLPLAAQLAQELGVSISALSQTEPWLQCNASLAKTKFGDAELKRLAPLERNLLWLDLAGTRVTDAGLACVAAMPHLTRLHLERTGVTDAGLKCLACLPKLTYLNLVATKVTDAGFASLRQMASLRQLYVWETSMTTEAINAFAASREDKSQVAQWRAQIAELEKKILAQRIQVEGGAPAPVMPAHPNGPINTLCPVTAKPVDLSQTSVYAGKTVAFCCDKCKSAFDQNPKGCLPRLGLAEATTPAKEKQP